MTISVTIDENDFLIYQLYITSQSARVRKKRLRSKILVPIIYLFMGICSLIYGSIFLAFFFFLVGVLWYFFYPSLERRRYVKHFKSVIKENFSDRFNKVAFLSISDESISARDDSSESKISTSEIEAIIEISSSIFIKINGGMSYILPKNKIEEIDMLAINLKKLANHLKINYVMDNEWKWK